MIPLVKRHKRWKQKFGLAKTIRKTAKICGLSTLVLVGNKFLADYAKQYNSNVFILPTILNIDYHNFSKSQIKKSAVCIGWTGTTTTLKHFYTAIPVLKRIKENTKEKVYFKVIANTKLGIKILT